VRHESRENIRLYTLPNEKTTSPSLTRTRQKDNHSPLQLPTTPKERRKIIYKQKLPQPTGPLLHFHTQKNLFSKRKKSTEQIECFFFFSSLSRSSKVSFWSHYMYMCIHDDMIRMLFSIQSKVIFYFILFFPMRQFLLWLSYYLTSIISTWRSCNPMVNLTNIELIENW
jgi:hypothetical protein